MSEPRVPASLLETVERGLRPVRPLLAPGRRALFLLPLGLLFLVGVPAFWGWRSNFASLGPIAAWGLSGAQTLAGLLIVALAFREAVPGRELSAAGLGATIGLALVLFVVLTVVTDLIVPAAVPPGVWMRFAWECFGVAALSAIPLLVAAAWLAARALPTRPAVAGAIYGLGAGFMADAGIRLFCWVSAPAHVLISHGGAILAAVLAGALAATLVERIKVRR